MSDFPKRFRLLVPAKLEGSFAPAFWRGCAWLACSAVIVCLLLLSRVAEAQSATATTLTATAAGSVSGSIVTMTANVSSGGQPVTGGTVTFQDAHLGVTQILGTVQVQSANGTPGSAILMTEVGGVGAHSIVAVYNSPQAYTTSTSASVVLTFQSPYSSATALAITGSSGSYTLTGTVSAFGPIQPTGSITFTDQTSSATIGTVPLNTTTATQGLTPPTLYPITTAQPWGTYSTGTPVTGDFNGDGRPDFAIPTSLGPVIVMLGHGDGTFQQGASISAVQPFGAVTGDFNGDGILDIAVGNRGTNDSLAIYLGNGDGTFQAGAVYNAAPNADYQILALGDFNRDGIPDIAVTDHVNNQVAVYLGNGDGTFRGSGLFQTGPEPWNIVVGDVNNDGDPDLVIADDVNDTQGNNITILLGNGDGTFQSPTYLVGGVTSSGSVALADFNGDGNLDIAATEEPANNVFVFLGNGNGTFKAKTTYTMNKGPFYLTTGDFNQDGNTDISTANAEGESVGILLGNGDGTFQPATTYSAGGAAIYANVRDFNGDNQVDVLAVTQNGMQVYLAGNAESAQYSPFTASGCVTQSIVATYSSDTNYAASTSPVQSVTQNGTATTISLVQTPTNAVYGQTITLTATVTPFTAGSNSGDIVTFFDGTANIGSGNVSSSGVATITLSSPTTGSHSFTAVFGGDCNYNLTGSTSVALLETVGKATPTVTWANPAPIAYGTALSTTQLNATASAPGNAAVPVTGTFVYTPAVNAYPAAGTVTLSVTFTPNDTTDYATVTTTVPITVTPATLTLSASDAKRQYGAANPTFTGTITGQQGSDTFTESFTTAATATSAPGTYSIVPSATGTNLANYTQVVNNGTLTIYQASATASLTASPLLAAQGQAVTLTATVASSTTGTPTGTVNFLDNGNPLGTGTLTNGVATYSATTLPLGNNVITASYSGDTNFSTATATGVSVTVAQNVLAITANSTSRVYGAANPTFTGTITGEQNGDTFTEGFTTSATTSSVPGTYDIVPSASGPNLSQYQQSIQKGTLTITQASATSTLTLSATSVTQGQSVTATVLVTSATSGTPTGTVTFLNNGKSLGTATLSNGTATYSTTSLPVGSNVITATYGGDPNFTGNTASAASGANTVVVTAPAPLDFTLALGGGSGTLSGTYGSSVQVTLQLTPTAGQYPAEVQFTASGSSAVSTTYTFTPSTVAATAGATTVALAIQLPTSASLDRGPTISRHLPSIALAFLLLPLASVRRMRKSGKRLGKSIGLSALMLAILGATALSITGCGGGSGSSGTGTPTPVSDSIVVTATSGSVSHNVTVSLSVQ
jgi:hypothetical protein